MCDFIIYIYSKYWYILPAKYFSFVYSYFLLSNSFQVDLSTKYFVPLLPMDIILSFSN